MRRPDEKGVSPVIGVILMVAITVILAAVIASFVFGMGSSVKRTYNVAATASVADADGDGNVDDIVITYQGGPDWNAVVQINASVDGNDCGNGLTGNPVPVGSTITCRDANQVGQLDHVVVTATFVDGTTQVILDTNV